LENKAIQNPPSSPFIKGGQEKLQKMIKYRKMISSPFEKGRVRGILEQGVI
jgi:hypothetical protein